VDEELALAAAHAVRGAGGTFGVGVGGSGGGSLHEQGFAELSHGAAQLKKEQRTLAVAFYNPHRHHATKTDTLGKPSIHSFCSASRGCLSDL
jgi:hypothetical protein